MCSGRRAAVVYNRRNLAKAWSARRALRFWSIRHSSYLSPRRLSYTYRLSFGGYFGRCADVQVFDDDSWVRSLSLPRRLPANGPARKITSS